MSDEKYTLKIDPVTRDLVLDDEGVMEIVTGDDVSAQAVRLTLPRHRIRADNGQEALRADRGRNP